MTGERPQGGSAGPRVPEICSKVTLHICLKSETGQRSKRLSPIDADAGQPTAFCLVYYWVDQEEPKGPVRLDTLALQSVEEAFALLRKARAKVAGPFFEGRFRVELCRFDPTCADCRPTANKGGLSDL